MSKAMMSLATISSALAFAVPSYPDTCTCDGNKRSRRGADCDGQAVIECRYFADSSSFDDVVNDLKTLAQIPDVTDLTIANNEYNGLEWNDYEYETMGSLLSAFPPAQLKRLFLDDERVYGCTQSNEGVAAFGAGLVNMTSLEELLCNFRGGLGIGSLTCGNESFAQVPPGQLTGLAGLGVAVSQIKTLRLLDLNFDYPNGGYRICDADVAAFAEYALNEMSNLQVLALGLNNMEVTDVGLSALGAALGKLPLTGAQLRLKVIDRQWKEITSTRGAVDIWAGLAHETMETLAVSMHLSEDGDAKTVYDAMGAALEKMTSLELLNLEFQDQDLHADRSGLTSGLSKVETLKLMHADVPCIPCGPGDAPWQCSDSGTFSDVIAEDARCIECNTTPSAGECNCWIMQEYNCEYCDLGNWVPEDVRWTKCLNWPQQQTMIL